MQSSNSILFVIIVLMLYVVNACTTQEKDSLGKNSEMYESLHKNLVHEFSIGDTIQLDSVLFVLKNVSVMPVKDSTAFDTQPVRTKQLKLWLDVTPSSENFSYLPKGQVIIHRRGALFFFSPVSAPVSQGADKVFNQVTVGVPLSVELMYALPYELQGEATYVPDPRGEVFISLGVLK